MGSSASKENHVVIVGGGMAGLSIANRLTDMGIPFTLFERHNRLGGRIHTLEHYECAAFRLFGEHTETHALVRKLGLHADPWPVETIKLHGLDGVGVPDPISPRLTPFDSIALATSPSLAARVDASTGYDGHTRSASTRLGKRDTTVTFVREGLTALVDGLTKTLDPANIQLDTRVCGVKLGPTGLYRVHTMHRSGKSSDVEATHVVLALPPQQAASFRCVRLWAKPLLSMLHSVPLHRIYAKVKGLPKSIDTRLHNTRIFSDTPLRQTMGCPPLYGKDQSPWVQVSYTSGDLATAWNRLWMSGDRNEFRKLITRNLKRVLETAFRVALDEIDVEDVRSHYWEEAVHGWEPSSRIKETDLRLTLHRKCAPRVVWAGEAVSHEFHGWIEGALRTARDAMRELCNENLTTRLPIWSSLEEARHALRKPIMVIDGRVLDVAEWAKTHPGGDKAITNHVNEDVTDLWRTYHQHSRFAWRSVFDLQVGWIVS